MRIPVLVNIFSRGVKSFWDRGKAEENIFYMKQVLNAIQRIQLENMKKELLAKEKALDDQIRKTEEIIDQLEKDKVAAEQAENAKDEDDKN